MRVVTIALTFALIVVGMCLQSNNTNRLLQTLQRTATVGKMCAQFPDRTTIVDQKTKTDAQNNKIAMQASFKKSGNQIINTILHTDGGILNGTLVVLPDIGTQVGLFAGPFLLGLIIIIFIWPFLCCCCCCPGCCPSKCCQKPENELYTKCELIWPSVVLILALLIMIVASVIGITRASDIQTSYQAVGCSAAITFDDVINGNVSAAGTYFIGMNGLANTLNALKGNMVTVAAQLNQIKSSNTGGVLMTAKAQGDALLDEISKIPDGTVGGSMPALSYFHFDGTGTSSSVSSTFPTFLGTAASGSPTGAAGTAHTVVKGVNDGLLTIATNAQSFASQTGTAGTMIDQLVSSMQDMVNLVNGFDGMVSGVDDSVTPITKIITMAVTAVFGVFIGLGVLSIVGTLLMTFCDKFSCRYLVYFVCVILFILGIFAFLIAFLFSVLTPIIYFGCDFISVSISSSAGFNTNLGSVLGGQFSSYLSVCLPGGTGDLINQLGIDLSAINGLSGAVNSMRAFDPTQLQTAVDTALTTLSDQINSYYYTDRYDFSSQSDRDIMARIANPANFGGCTNNHFQTDNWIPSLRQSDIGCSGTARSATSTQCPSTTQVQAGQASTLCYGCMDTMKIIAGITTFTTDIGNRYGSAQPDCVTWVNQMTLLHDKYYSPKKTAFAPVISQMGTTTNRFNTATTGYNDQLTAVGNTFTTVITNLEGIVSTVFDPQYGLIAGLNCLLLGDDINLIANTTCAKLFNTLFFLRLSLGLSAFGILFAMCCSTCSGVRAFKHSTRSGTIMPKQSQLPQQSTMAAFNQKY